MLNDKRLNPMILTPGKGSKNLTNLAENERQEMLAPDKTPLVIVIDGTWHTARKMLRLSANLHALPRVCFSPSQPSNFRVRKQPAPECTSTLEAIHHTIELLGPACGFAIASRMHDNLIHVFDTMVERQLEYVRVAHATKPYSRHRHNRSA